MVTLLGKLTSQLQELKQLQVEHAQLKRMDTEQALHTTMLKDVLGKSGRTFCEEKCV